MNTIIKLTLLTSLLALGACYEIETGTDNSIDTFSTYVDAKGLISRPTGFREDWTHLGSWYVTSEGMSSGASIHDVYATPASIKAFKQTGEWPDGSVLVKTVSDTKTQQMTTGHARSAQDIGVWFVMVRDRHDRFPANEAWGEGWGWALFTAESPDKNLTTNWKGTGFNNCFGCHVPAKETDWVYIDGYPTVRDSFHAASK